jgi:UDP-2,3-diacylglucosamine pyrophosphatase LpxH
MKVITRKLEAASRTIVFSDCHRGVGSAGDEFARNSMVYKFALEYYLREGFTLIELGDAEELWENSDFTQIYITHTSVYDLLAKFHDPDPARTRYIKIWGNHDLDWQDDVAPLRATFPGIEAYEAALLDAGGGGRVLLLHGHQADPVCYGWRARLARWGIRHLWRGLQDINIGDPTTRAAENPGRCNKTDKALTELAREVPAPEKMAPAKQNCDGGKSVPANLAPFSMLHPTVVVAGHTHRPVFAGLSLTERRLLEVGGGAGPPGIARKNGPEAIYYNTGACVLPRSITGIEITAEPDAGGAIRPHFSLVKWSVQPASPDNPALVVARTLLEK